MKKIAVPFLLSFLLVSCGDDSSNAADNSGKNKTVSGVAQLGAFEKGSTLSVYELNENLKQTGFNIESSILNDQGEFSIHLKDIESQHALFKADGYYHNTITGENVREKAILYALADLDKRSKVNINILTHLSHKRAIYLVSEKDMSYAEAKKQAEAEVLKSFGIDEEFDDAETLNIIGNDNQSIALLAMSILMQSERSETELNDRLTQYPTDIEGDGIWDDEKTIAKIADWAYNVYKNSAFGAIKEYVKTWNSSAVFSIFEKYVNAFWHHHYGLEVCTDDRINEVLKNELSASDFDNKYFICRPGGKWKEASEEQVQKFFKIDENATEGMSRIVPKQSYPYKECQVYEDGQWRKGNDNDCYRGLGGCTKKHEGLIKTTTNSDQYVCHNQEWTYISPDLESLFQPIKFDLDTIGWKDTTDGTIRKGNITDIIYIFDKDAWRVANLVEATLGKCSKENLDSAGYIEKRSEQSPLNPLSYVCQHNMEISGHYYGNCPDNIYTPGYYKCHYGVLNDSKDTIYAWSYVNDKCSLGPYDLKDGKLIHWKDSYEGDTRWSNLWTDSQETEYTSQKRCEINCNKFKDGNWNFVDKSECLGFGTCNENLIGKIKQGPTLYYEQNTLVKIDTLNKSDYVCRAPISIEEYDYTWRVANSIDIKMAEFKCTRDGALVSTKANPDDLYVCDVNGYREASPGEKMIGLGCTYFTREKKYLPDGLKSYFICDNYDSYDFEHNLWYLAPWANKGTMTDPRDGTVYKTTNIGAKTWMAENLNYADSSNYPSMLERNKCEDNDLDNCKKDGRLYTWSAIIDSVYWASKGKTCGNTKDNDKKCDLPDVVQGICPKGWHVPSVQEWDDLSSWMDIFYTEGSYSDYGFIKSEYKEFYFWTSTASTDSTSYSNIIELLKFASYNHIRSTVSKTKDTHLAVRCVKDD